MQYVIAVIAGGSANYRVIDMDVKPEMLNAILGNPELRDSLRSQLDLPKTAHEESMLVFPIIDAIKVHVEQEDADPAAQSGD